MLLHTASLGAARVAVTDRKGGTSVGAYAGLNLGGHVGDDPAAVEVNRRLLLEALPGARRLAFMEQVHGRAVATVPSAPGRPPVADAAVTTVPGVALVVLSADCVPVLLAARNRAAVAVAHAGRLGVQHGVVGAAVATLVEAGADPADVSALVGPAVCGRCYEVPAAMRDEVAAVVPAAAASTREGTPSLDLPAAVRAQLSEAGVADVTLLGACTVESSRLFSHRRDGVTGRIAGVAWLPDEDGCG